MHGEVAEARWARQRVQSDARAAHAAPACSRKHAQAPAPAAPPRDAQAPSSSSSSSSSCPLPARGGGSVCGGAAPGGAGGTCPGSSGRARDGCGRRGGRRALLALLVALAAVARLPLGSCKRARRGTAAPAPPPPPAPPGLAALHSLYPNHSWGVAVEASDVPRGSTRVEVLPIPFVQVLSDADQGPLYQENLEQDLAPWREPYRNRTDVRIAGLLEWAERLPRKASQRIVLIKGGRVALLRQGPGGASSPTCDKPCDPILEDLLADLRVWVAEAPSEWPDVAFFINVADTSLCQGSGGGHRRSKTANGPCPAPVLSVIKEWERHKDEDILVPITVGQHRWRPLYYFPWRRKIERAVFRGREYCHTKGYAYAKGTCSRTYFAQLSQVSPEWRRYLDVGLVDNYTTRLPDGTDLAIAARGFVPTQELARFRYVLALDGITASSRLARLLSLNSVVLKQASPWIEYYYRSLVPGTHYITFWNHHRTDILQAMKYLRHKERYLLDVAMHGQAFAYRYLTPNARRLYWRRTLVEYAKLFSAGDMEAFVASQVV